MNHRKATGTERLIFALVGILAIVAIGLVPLAVAYGGLGR